ncbi:MAG TPA: hypothetical protein VJR89_39660, partial [Polyangiales bacterium]|nr:hypothetical protein [Polyangiales bacterium]
MSTRSRWNCVFWLGMGVCFASFACSIAAGPLRDAYFSADQLYLPTLLADLTRWGGDLAAWHLTPAPYFFPDLVLYAVAWQLTRGLPYSIEAAQYLTGILQLAWLVLVARALVHRTLPSDCRACALIAPIWAVWISLYLAGAGAVVLPGLVFSSHSGALLSTLTVFALTLRPAHAPRALGTLCVVALSFLTGASDALFVMSCSAVLAVTAGWCSIAPRSSLAAPVSLLRAWLGAVAGIAGLVASRRLGFASAAQLDGSFDVALEDARKIWTESDAFPRATVLALL